MNNAQDWVNEFIQNIPYIQKEMIEDAKTMKTYGKAKKYVKEFKFDFGGNYNATPTEQVMSAFNSMIDEVVTELNHESDKGEIK